MGDHYSQHSYFCTINKIHQLSLANCNSFYKKIRNTNLKLNNIIGHLMKELTLFLISNFKIDDIYFKRWQLR